MKLMVNGVSQAVSHITDPLTRAVAISLFTWRRAGPDDDVNSVMGWWGDSYPTWQNDRIGSRLYQLRREKLTNKTPMKAREYIIEALQWLVDDEVIAHVDVSTERTDVNSMYAAVTLYKQDGTAIALAFDDLWRELDG
ncbi:phage GP46 family protein [Pectobacteriaceae bacterium C52]|nr:phage GP46 family protein [Pectobacteriaceae bacterium C52]WJY17177.1 phage GP46 family protein [Pectobacteriaceae bacterium CE90]WJY17252.1 phage GP46 family protein [Pectobacteriaceae bacterium CE90]